MIALVDECIELRIEVEVDTDLNNDATNIRGRQRRRLDGSSKREEEDTSIFPFVWDSLM